MAQGSARHPGERVLLVRHRLPDGSRHLPRRRAPRRARARGLGRRARRARRRHRRSRSSRAASATSTIDRALRLLGLGTAADPSRRGRRSGAHARRRARGGAPRRSTVPTIVCAQAGEVNTGAFDSLEEIAASAARRGAWLHVDGAFGLWAAASPRAPSPDRRERSGRTPGRPMRTSGSTSRTTAGSRSSRTPRPTERRCALTAEYLVADPSAARDQMDWTPEFSRRARGFAVYAALRSLGRSGVADLVERLLRPRPPVRGGDRAAPGLRRAERRRAEPGPLPLRRRRDDERGARRTSRQAARRG